MVHCSQLSINEREEFSLNSVVRLDIDHTTDNNALK